jgi:hypothetical protein
MSERIGDYIQTFTGKRFWPLDPRVEEIDIHDIAHALSNQCRYTGHSVEFYSIAEHSVYVGAYCPNEYHMWGLLHDASEAYICDVARPLKHREEFSFYREIEANIMRVIAEKFNLPFPEPPIVKEIDTQCLTAEAPQLMLHTDEWGGMTTPLPIALFNWHPKTAERQFLSSFVAYGGRLSTTPSLKA